MRHALLTNDFIQFQSTAKRDLFEGLVTAFPDARHSHRDTLNCYSGLVSARILKPHERTGKDRHGVCGCLKPLAELLLQVGKPAQTRAEYLRQQRQTLPATQPQDA